MMSIVSMLIAAILTVLQLGFAALMHPFDGDQHIAKVTVTMIERAENERSGR